MEETADFRMFVLFLKHLFFRFFLFHFIRVSMKMLDSYTGDLIWKQDEWEENSKTDEYEGLSSFF